MISDAFDTSKPIITPSFLYKPMGFTVKTCIVTFSPLIMKRVLATFKNEKIAQLNGVHGPNPIYRIKTANLECALVCSNIGSALSGATLEEVNALLGTTNFIEFGSAGSLDNEKTSGKFVVPTEAFRDEGMSYHYAAPSDFITVKNHSIVASVLQSMNLPYVEGKVWTTDAFYRETVDRFTKLKNEGCIAVEMEIAGLQAVSDFYGFNLYSFVTTGDVLSNIDGYSSGNLNEANHRLDYFDIALKIAEQIKMH